MIYLAIVVAAAVYLGRGPSLLAAITGVLAFDFFLVPPYLTFAVSDTQYFLTFAALLAVSLIVSALTARVREQAEAAIQRETRATALYNLGRDLTSVTDLGRISQIIISHPGAFGRVAIFLPGRSGAGRCQATTPMKTSWLSRSGRFSMISQPVAARILCQPRRCDACP
jgi:two-component system sensor histidine kinase KdpD